MKFTELETMRIAAIRYVAVLYEAQRQARIQKAKKAKVKVGRKFPRHLLKRAVFLFWHRWSAKHIGTAIGRSSRSIED